MALDKKQKQIRDELFDKEPRALHAARHEAAHAVMMKILGLPATRITLNDTGGFCEGTGKIIRREEDVLCSLAGFAWETLFGIAPPVDQINFETSRHTIEDLRQAWEILDRFEHLRIVGILVGNGEWMFKTESVKTAIRRYYSRAMKELNPHRDLILATGAKLYEAGELSARRTAALLRGVTPGLDPP